MTFTRLGFLLVLVATNSPSTRSLSPILPSLPRRPTRRQGTARHATRRHCLEQISVATAMVMATQSLPSPARSAETIGKDDDCNDGNCLGVWDGMLADCPHGKDGMRGALWNTGAGCVSSQDDTPGIFAEPWDYSEAPNRSLDWQDQMNVLVPTLQLVSARRGDKVAVELKQERYLRVLFTDKASGESSVGEFYFTPNDTTVQFRIGSIGDPIRLASLRNTERSELIRKELRYLKIPVLRNRSRSLFFGESDLLDTFGPGSAMLGPPAEMTGGELEGRGSENADPNLKIDFVQKFPRTSR